MAENEINVNIRSALHLAVGLLPYLRSKHMLSLLGNLTSMLGFVSFSIINPVYIQWH
ncbi:uncharacterized protein F4807DRAFT_423932 [Annulohypoxylon truncatum]|uniref:uncharacterized protein n=1 Tax=Annulohypoxylon truncatum TaxID=327061 RepID=UPI002007E470|nr:uncharacterized protein F4807DRAFT_423932 [Annulohypoxylon truncatum]KAI1210137.1 hypothetical protein F4807DRAFT_423932 [Annulohypoxylon truncatum]